MTTLNKKVKWRLVDCSETTTTQPKKTGAWGAKPQTVQKKEILKYAGSDKRSDAIDNWFFSQCEDDVSPYIFTKAFAEAFLQELQHTDFDTIYIPSIFIKKMCAAVTAYVYYDYFEHKQVGVPRDLQKIPKGWTVQTISIWYDFVQSRFLNDQFFDRFWHSLPPTIWEEAYPQIRVFLQSILPYYIKYNNDLLVDKELIAVNSEGEYVDPAEADVEDEEPHPYD